MAENTKNMQMKNNPGIVDYRGDCWRAYQDVGLCLRILPPGGSFEFVLEREKYSNIKKIIDRNGGTILSESNMENGIQIKVLKVSKPAWVI